MVGRSKRYSTKRSGAKDPTLHPPKDALNKKCGNVVAAAPCQDYSQRNHSKNSVRLKREFQVSACGSDCGCYPIGMDDWLQTIPGAQALFDWFGYWPSFHDSEVLGVELNRRGSSKIRVHAFGVTGAVDSNDLYVCEKHCTVTMVLDDVSGVELADFNHQNVISSLKISRENNEFILMLASSYGVAGSIRARSVRIEIAAGIPEDSQYKK